MLRDAFDHVETWVFDLDNTLYPPEARLFDQVELRMTDWVMEALGVDRAKADLTDHIDKPYLANRIAAFFLAHQEAPNV